MIIIIISWIYISFICYIYGSFTIELFSNIFKLDNKPLLPLSLYFITGICFLSAVSTISSFWFKINEIYNLIILLIAILKTILYKKHIIIYLKYCYSSLQKTNIFVWIIYLFSILILSYYSLQSTTNSDDGLYYSTYIKWIQQYHVVPGLGNLHPRLAFNSSWHIVQALFGLTISNKILLNDINGLLYLWVWLYSLGGINNLIKSQRSFSTFIRSFFFLPILPLYTGLKPLLIHNFFESYDFIFLNDGLITSPAADIPAMLIVWIVFNLFINKIDQKQLYTFDYSSLLIILFSFTLITIKLSTLPILILSATIFIPLIVRKEISNFIKIFLLSFIILLPWIVINYYLSGYLIFPFSSLDIFNVDWKVPIRDAAFQQQVVKTWAIHLSGYDSNQIWKMPIWEWFPQWYSGISFIQTIMVQFIILLTFLYLLFFFKILVKRKLKEFQGFLILIICNLIGILFWINSAPEFRFGYGFTIFYCITGLAIFTCYFLKRYPKQLAAFIFIYALIINYSTFQLFFPDINNLVFKIPNRILSIKENYQTLKLKDGNLINLGSQTNCTGIPLPCAPDHEPCDRIFGLNNRKIIFRGRTVQEGFKVY